MACDFLLVLGVKWFDLSQLRGVESFQARMGDVMALCVQFLKSFSNLNGFDAVEPVQFVKKFTGMAVPI